MWTDNRRALKDKLDGEDESALKDDSRQYYERRMELFGRQLDLTLRSALLQMSRYDFERLFYAKAGKRDEATGVPTRVLHLRDDFAAACRQPVVLKVRPCPKPTKSSPGFATRCESILKAHRPYVGTWVRPAELELEL